MSEPDTADVESPKSHHAMLQCQRCGRMRKVESFSNSAYQWCNECVAAVAVFVRNEAIEMEVKELTRKVITARNADQNMATMEEFFVAFDDEIGGARGLAGRMVEALEGLCEKKSWTSAALLIIQIQKLRFHVEGKRVDDDFTQMDLEQKRTRLRIEMVKMLAETLDEEKKQVLLDLFKNAHESEPIMNDIDAVTTLNR